MPSADHLQGVVDCRVRLGHDHQVGDARHPRWLNDRFAIPGAYDVPELLNLKHFIRDIPDFPKPGILFRDITPLLAHAGAFRQAITQLADHYRSTPIDVIAAAEARGFVFAAPLAMELNVGFVPIRKPGKLPADTHRHSYELEYGTDTLEMHVDDVQPGQRVLVVDDLLATGGTVEACCQLVEKSGATVVGCAFLIELVALRGIQRMGGRQMFALLRY